MHGQRQRHDPDAEKNVGKSVWRNKEILALNHLEEKLPLTPLPADFLCVVGIGDLVAVREGMLGSEKINRGPC